MTSGRFDFFFLFLALLFVGRGEASSATNGNRLTYLDHDDPFHVQAAFPKLTTPQWIGEEGVEAVVILAIDDLRSPEKYEATLRPIITRLQKIDGRGPVSIFCNALNPESKQFEIWLGEGLSLENHTLSHPCPLLAQGNFDAALQTYQGGIELLQRIPGNQPVAFRMPCCDSMNSPSPRFYAGMFSRADEQGRHLQIDSSVMNIMSSKDPSLPRDLVLDADGRERFWKYLPGTTNATTRVSMGSFTTTIENYPYPYVIGRTCWEFPAMVPSDWEAQNVHGSNNPKTVADWEAALDLTVLKQGVFTFIFHPHGWIKPEQLVQFIDYAVEKYGKRVKFLTFAESARRLNSHLLQGHPLRTAQGVDNGVRLLDLNNDHYIDVVSARPDQGMTRVWNPTSRRWIDSSFPTPLVSIDAAGSLADAGVRFGVLDPQGQVVAFVRTENASGAWIFEGQSWRAAPEMMNGLELNGSPVRTRQAGRDAGFRFRDVDRDGLSELLVANPNQNAVFGWLASEKRWEKQSYALPPEMPIVDATGQDAGLRFVDLNGDGYDDMFLSNASQFVVKLFVPEPALHLDFPYGWSHPVRAGRAGDSNAPPPVVRSQGPRNNGAWIARDHIWWQNEDTAHLPDKVDRRSFRQLLAFDSPPPLSPADALGSFELSPGFTIELVAHEPLVKDPVAFEWGADGKLWVVEMGDYPSGLDGKSEPGGVLRFLEDKDNDGRYETSTVFLDRLNFPTGVMPWRRGVIVSAAPEIFYAEDTDGDGRADVRRPLLQGFHEGNQQHRVNGFEYGLDNWLYGANGESGGTIKVAGNVQGPSTPDQRSQIESAPINLRGHDFRFRPDTGLMEAIAGATQYGRHRDDWGNWFGNSNPSWLWHYWIEERHLRRNPHLPVRTLKQSLANYPDATRVFSRSPRLQRFNWPNMVNILTSANSPTPYRDVLFGDEFASSVFISEPANNLVHREVLQPDGPTFKSRRASTETEREFLASRDNWFRPTMLKTGPDGALYIADMYRLVIEHLEYALPGMEKQIDVRAGDDKGRIYRVFPIGAQLSRVPRLDKLSGVELVAALDSSNGWQRDTVQRLLVHAADMTVAPPLRTLVAASKLPVVRLQALATLEGLNALTPATLQQGLRDNHSAVRAFAVGLSGTARSRKEGTAEFESREIDKTVLTLVHDPEPRVRYQLALTLGDRKDSEAGAALVELAWRDGDNEHIRTALLSSALPHLDYLLTALWRKPEQVSSLLLEQLFALASAAGRTEGLHHALTEVSKPSTNGYTPWQFKAVAGFLDGLQRRRMTLDQFAQQDGARFQSAVQGLQPLFDAAALVATNRTLPDQERLYAIRLLGRDGQTVGARGPLVFLLEPQEPAAIQQAALESLGRLTDVGVGTLLIERWSSFLPARRLQAMQVLLSRRPWTETFLEAIEMNRVPPGQVPAQVRRQLSEQGEGTIRQRAQAVFGALSTDRQKVLSDYEVVGKLTGVASRGLGLFRQHCASCHHVKGEGVDLGPNLAAITDNSIPALLTAILDPNRAVEPIYIGYTALLDDDRELTGVVLAETGNSVTLRAIGGEEEIVLRARLKQLTSNGLSLMPDGMEAALDPQAMADLLAFLRKE